MRRRIPASVLVLALALVAVESQAAITFDDDAPRVFSIQKRPYRLGHEFQLGVGTLPLDAFYVGAVVTASYTYHFSDFWAWEIAGGGYSLNFDTGLADDLLQQFGAVPVRGGGARIRVGSSTSAVIKPLFGKLTLFNRDVVHAETFFVAGIGPMLKGEFWRFAGNIGIGFRFWSTRALSVRFDVRDYLVFSGYVPQNSLMLQLSAAFNYYDRPEEP